MTDTLKTQWATLSHAKGMQNVDITAYLARPTRQGRQAPWLQHWHRERQTYYETNASKSGTKRYLLLTLGVIFLPVYECKTNVVSEWL